MSKNTDLANYDTILPVANLTSSNTVTVGNTTANSVLNQIVLSIANSTTTANLTASGLVVGTTVVNSSVYFSGNSTANTTGSLTTDAYSNSTITSVYGLGGANVGANVVISPTGLSVGNSTVNTAILNNQLFLSTTSGIFANGSVGTSKQILSSNGTASYWGPAPIDYNTTQSISSTQQTQARNNIQSASIDAMAYLNLAINPFHTISQQNGSTANAAVNGYVTDQNLVLVTGPTLSGQQVANPFPSYPAIPYGLKLLVTMAKVTLAAGDYILQRQYLEGQRVAKLGFGTSQAQPLLVGQLMRSNIALTGYIAIHNGASNRSYLKQFTLASNTDTWVTAIIPGDTTGTWTTDTTIGLQVDFCFAAGSTFQGTAGSWQASNLIGASDTTNLGATLNNQVICSGLMVMPAFTTTLADMPGINDLIRFQRHPDDELRACQRYFYRATQPSWKGVAITATNSARTGGPHPTRMRTIPTMTFSGSISVYDGSVTPTITATPATYCTVDTAEADMTVSGGSLTTGRVVVIYQQGAGYFDLNARM